MNALNEIVAHLKEIRGTHKRNVGLEALLVKHHHYGTPRNAVFGTNLQDPQNWEDCERLLSKIEYDAGYGSQELSGTIWYTDGTWSERVEYDGSEWWAYRCRPEIPTFQEVLTKSE